MKRLKKASIFFVVALLSFTLCSTTASAASYKVAKKDSLYKISKLFKTSVKTIKKDNKLKSSTIVKGQKIKVRAKIYTVKNGDTLYKIAKKYKISLTNLKKANHKSSNALKVGQKLMLPGIKPTTAKKTASTTSTASKSKAVISYTSKEEDLLARLITAEATGQPYDAMVAIGGVVVNRVQSSKWPDSIDAVINHVSGGYYQFTPVKNGYIKNPASATAKKAAKAALTGSDPSKNAMFYFDDSSTNSWLWSKTVTAQYGKMVFVK